MRRPRLTVRGMLLLIVLAAVAARVVVTARRVNDRVGRWVRHEWQDVRDPSRQFPTFAIDTSWSRIVKEALSLPWDGAYACEGTRANDPDACPDSSGGYAGPAVRYLGSRPTTPEEGGGVEASLSSLRILGPISREPDETPPEAPGP